MLRLGDAEVPETLLLCPGIDSARHGRMRLCTRAIDTTALSARGRHVPLWQLHPSLVVVANDLIFDDGGTPASSSRNAIANTQERGRAIDHVLGRVLGDTHEPGHLLAGSAMANKLHGHG